MVEIARIRKALQKFGRRFTERIFTRDELGFAAQFPDPAPHLAARFAAKEAAAKALGTGLSGKIGWRDIEVSRKAGSPPVLFLHGAAAEIARQLDIQRWHISLTHTAHWASVVVIGEGA